jgi:archaellum component FlaC
MQSTESTLLNELKSCGFEIDGLREQKQSITDYAREVYEEASAHSRPGPRGQKSKLTFQENAIEARDGGGNRLGLLPRYGFVALVLSLAVTPFKAELGALLLLISGCFTLIFFLLFGFATFQDVWIRGLWRYLTDFSEPEPITDEEVIEHLSQQLREEKEKALGVTIADEKQKLEDAKSRLEDHRRTLRSQRKGNEDHGLEDEIDGFITAIDKKIAEIDEVLTRIDTFLEEVRQLAQDIASEILPVYKQRQKILETFQQVLVDKDDVDEHLESAESKLQESRLNLDEKLEALQPAITRANLISTELGKLTAEDALEEGSMDGVIGSVEQLTDGVGANASAEAQQRVRV